MLALTPILTLTLTFEVTLTLTLTQSQTRLRTQTAVLHTSLPCLTGGSVCFAASATVIVRDVELHTVERRLMADLQIGDTVMVLLVPEPPCQTVSVLTMACHL